jgi:hypothetical protein
LHPTGDPDTEFQVRVSVVPKPVLILLITIGAGVAGYFTLPLTPIPDYVAAVMERANQLF